MGFEPATFTFYMEMKEILVLKKKKRKKKKKKKRRLYNVVCLLVEDESNFSLLPPGKIKYQVFCCQGIERYGLKSRLLPVISVVVLYTVILHFYSF